MAAPANINETSRLKAEIKLLKFKLRRAGDRAEHWHGMTRDLRDEIKTARAWTAELEKKLKAQRELARIAVMIEGDLTKEHWPGRTATWMHPLRDAIAASKGEQP